MGGILDGYETLLVVVDMGEKVGGGEVGDERGKNMAEASRTLRDTKQCPDNASSQCVRIYGGGFVKWA